jgi:pimeloyl-ACP methyl ester carboxylesterase
LISTRAPSSPALTPESPLSPSPSLSTSPSSFSNGRYQVKKFLGEGGKKKVYLTHDTLLDREVAFALIKTEKLDQASRQRIKQVPYTYYDMGEDAVGLLDALGIEKAHICGISMGGAIAQTIAISHPERLLSLIIIYAPIGNPNLPQPKPEIMSLLMAPPATDRNAYIEQMIKTFQIISGSGFPVDEERGRQAFKQAYERSYYPEGVGRNLLASFGRGNRSRALPSVTASTLVIHGDEDPLVPVENGRDAAQAIPGAELMIIKGMGHYPPHGGPWPQIVKAISDHTRKASI